MKANGYPNASVVLALIEERLQKEQEMAMQMAAMQNQPQMEVSNEVPLM